MVPYATAAVSAAGCCGCILRGACGHAGVFRRRGCVRIAIMPLDTVKTTFQVAGADAGAARLRERLASRGPRRSARGARRRPFVHYPWFATYNGLSAAVAAPPASRRATRLSAGRARLQRPRPRGEPGVDTCSNSLGVLKTAKQTAETPVGARALGRVVAEAGRRSLQSRPADALRPMASRGSWRCSGVLSRRFGHTSGG